MTDDFSREVARDIGSLQADMRTVKHDVSNVSAKLDALSIQISNVNDKQQRGLGFFAGMAFILTSAGGILIALGKLLFGQGA